jgi:hypothetical protein
MSAMNHCVYWLKSCRITTWHKPHKKVGYWKCSSIQPFMPNDARVTWCPHKPHNRGAATACNKYATVTDWHNTNKVKTTYMTRKYSAHLCGEKSTGGRTHEWGRRLRPLKQTLQSPPEVLLAVPCPPQPQIQMVWSKACMSCVLKEIWTPWITAPVSSS